MPTLPRKRYYRRLNKLHRELRRTRTAYSTICPKQGAQYAINRIEQILERDTASHSAISPNSERRFDFDSQGRALRFKIFSTTRSAAHLNNCMTCVYYVRHCVIGPLTGSNATSAFCLVKRRYPNFATVTSWRFLSA
jgi:hypothetical protein